MSKQTNPTRTCADCFHCKACHMWSGAISNTVAEKCPQFETVRYATLKELQDLYKMYKGEVAPVKYGEWIENEDIVGDTYYTCSACGEVWTCIEGTPAENNMHFCPCCGARMEEV